MNTYRQLQQSLASIGLRLERDLPLSAYTTLGVGGAASFLTKVQNSRQLAGAVKSALQCNIPFKIIGRGSNLIVPDEGFPGLVIVNSAGGWRVMEDAAEPPCGAYQGAARYDSASEVVYLENEPSAEGTSVVVRADSGVLLSSLMNRLFREGISGLQWFAGIPATVGGAVYMNIHGGSHFFAEIVQRAALLDGYGKEKEVNREWFQFDYDSSRLQRSKDILLWADLCLQRGNVQAAREYARRWAAKKSHQPQRSAGCIFRNLTAEQQKQLNLSTPSVGYVIDRLLGLKGRRAGDAVISSKHAAFIENTGKATAKEVLTLIELIREKAKSELGIELQLEVEILKNNE